MNLIIIITRYNLSNVALKSLLISGKGQKREGINCGEEQIVNVFGLPQERATYSARV
jgi:hypothetical protein